MRAARLMVSPMAVTSICRSSVTLPAMTGPVMSPILPGALARCMPTGPAPGVPPLDDPATPFSDMQGREPTWPSIPTFAQPYPRVVSEARQDLGVVGEEAPVRHGSSLLLEYYY